MNPTPYDGMAVHLAIVQPHGNVHSLGLLDQARFFRHQFRRLGAHVTIGKNRLRDDAVNFVFGAHLGLAAEWAERSTTIIVNLQQLGQGGARVPPEYLDLLRCSAVIDHDAANVLAYRSSADAVPLFSFSHAPYLAAEPGLPLDQRPIDLLFIGTVNERRREFLDRVEATGRHVTIFDSPIYGPERDAIIRQSRAVVNCHFHETSRFDQGRAFQCLSLGTPFISERNGNTWAPPAFEESVFWLDDSQIDDFFGHRFGQPQFHAEAERRLRRFASTDTLNRYSRILSFAREVDHERSRQRPTGRWRADRLHIGSGDDYRPGWLNVDSIDRADPDGVVDLTTRQTFPLQLDGCRGGRLTIDAGQFRSVHVGHLPDQREHRTALMTNVLALLADGGELTVDSPCDTDHCAGERVGGDPSGETAWRPYTERFWSQGWFEHRFELGAKTWLDVNLEPCERAIAAFARMTLTKRVTTVRERMLARTMRTDFGGLGDDVDPVEVPVLRDVRSEFIRQPVRLGPTNASAGAADAVTA